MKLNIITLVATLIVIFLYLARLGNQPWTPWRIVGFAIALPAFVLFVHARLQLGSSFSVQAKANKLVTAGIYSHVRNPIYVFGGLFIAGVIVWLERPWWLLIFVVLIPLQMFRVRKEEQVLEAKFGNEYREYKLKTWF